MVLERLGEPLRERHLARPVPAPGEVLVEIEACGVCRTDLHVVDGELDAVRPPLVPGHQIVGRVAERGAGSEGPEVGQRVGIAWLGWTCGECRFCRSDRENLCERARFTGYTLPGGYAEAVVADSRFAFPLPASADAAATAPLLCAGLIGYRALRMCGDAERLGLYGFGSSAHLVAQIARAQGRRVVAFTRPGDEATQRFAIALGAEWAGDSDAAPPEPLDAAIVFAPIGALVPAALRALDRGGVVVCAGIHMSDIPSFPYDDLWLERSIRSVANLTRRDGEELLPLAAELGISPTVSTYGLEHANRALEDLRAGRVEGSAVLLVDGGEGAVTGSGPQIGDG
jgi:alcohol dehydrogenase, propanol-preferring